MYFAGNKSLLSKPLIKSNSSIPVYIGLLIGVAITGLTTIGIGQMGLLLSATPFIILIFAVVGILNFVIGRQLLYEAVKNIDDGISTIFYMQNLLQANHMYFCGSNAPRHTHQNTGIVWALDRSGDR